jgi:hypothetical protein
MFIGPELLAKVKELGDVSKSELVRECGYVSTKKDGGERLNFTAFYEALLGAKGVNIGTDTAGRGKGQGRLKVCHELAGAAMLVPVLSGLLPSVGRPRCHC